MEDPELRWARDWTEEVLEAWALHKGAKLENLAKSALKHLPSAQVLTITGAGLILAHAEYWESATDGARTFVAQALEKWRAHAKTTKVRAEIAKKSLGSRKTKGFAAAASHFNEWLAEKEGRELQQDIEQAAAEMALRGFDSWRKLRGLSLSDIADWSKKPPVVALLRRSLEYANSGCVVFGDKEPAEINMTGSVAAIAGAFDRQTEQAPAEEMVDIPQDCAALEEIFQCAAKRRRAATMRAADRPLQLPYGVVTAYGSKVEKNAVSNETESDDGEKSEVRRIHEQSKRESNVGERNCGFLI